MSLLDKASLVQIPSGYGDGKLYSVKPTPTYGSELVTNGDFSGGTTNWLSPDYNSTLSIVSGQMKIVSTISLGRVMQGITTVVGKKYLATATITNIDSSTGIQLKLSNGSNLDGAFFDSSFNTTTNAVTITHEFTATATTTYIGSSHGTSIGQSALLDNVSVKEVLKDGDFDFSRSSSATRVNSEGLIETAQILGNEEVTNGDFSNGSTGWTIINGTVTDKYNANMTAYQSGIRIVPFLKNGTFKVVFDLVITSGNCKFDAGGGNDEIYTTSGTKEKIITNPTKFEFNAFNLGWVGTLDNVSVKEVFQNDIPRLDYSGGATCPTLLLEGQSTNLVTYSEDFSHSSWTKVNASVSSNTTTSPSGATNASTLVSTSGTSEQYIDVGSLSVTSGEDYTMSVFVKKNNYDFFLIRFTGVGGAFSAGNVFFNINNGTLGTVDSGYTGSIESFANGWFRCSATKTASGTTASGKVRLQLATSDTTELISGDGSSGTFIYGSQFEQSSFATSYIPTSGSTVTRTADVCDNAGTSATFNSTEGVLFAEIAALADDLTNRGLALSDGTSSNACRIYYSNSSNNIRFFFNVGGSAQVIKSVNLTDITDYNKIAFSYKQDDFKIYINGVKVEEDTSGSVPSANTFNKLSFDRGYGGENFYGKCKQLMTFNEALSDSELQELTTL